MDLSQRRRTGSTLMAPTATSRGSTTIRSCISPTRMRFCMRVGPERNCRRKPSGNSPRAAGSTDTEFAWGDEFMPGNRAMANTWHGDFPHQRTTRVQAHITGDGVSAERLWRPRHDRQCVGVDQRLVLTQAPGRCAESLLHSGKSARWIGKRELRLLSAQHQNSAQGSQRRLASLRPELLPPLSPAARHAQPVDTSTSHVGFRCVVRTHKDA